MKRLFVCLLLGSLSLSLIAQSPNNIFKGYERYRFALSDHGPIWDMENVTTQVSGGDLIISFKAIHNNKDIPPYYYTLTIPLSRTKIINGYWSDYRDKYGIVHYVQKGDETKITFTGVINCRNVVPKWDSDKTRSYDKCFIYCSTSSEGNRLIKSLIDCQRPYKTPEPQYCTDVQQPSTNPYLNSSSREIFKKIKHYFEYYETNSETGRRSDNVETNNLKVTFKYPNLVFDFSDNYSKGIAHDSSVNEAALGRVTICVPITSSSVKRNGSLVLFTSNTGIERTINGRRNLIEQYGFYVSSMISEDLCLAIAAFFKKVEEEGFKGELGIISTAKTGGMGQTSSGAPTSSKPSISLPNKYECTRFIVSYPNGWSYVEDVQGIDVYIGANDGCIAFTVASFPTSYTLDEVMTEAKANAARAGWKQTNTITTLCGVKCYKSVITYTVNGMSVKQIGYTMKKNGYVYNLRFGNDANNVNSMLSTITAIANSFKVK